MKLIRYRVTNFRSVRDSGWIDCDQVTTLVGVNESGKSNLLLALWKLNPVREGKIDILHDMPVSLLSEMRSRQDEEKFITAEFLIDEESANTISDKAHCTCNVDTIVSVSRYYDGNYQVDFPGDKPHPINARKKKTDSTAPEESYTEEKLSTVILGEMPKFVYYSNYGNLSSKIYLPHVMRWLRNETIPGIEISQDQLRTLRVLFDFVKLDPKEIYELGKDPRAAHNYSSEPSKAEIEKADADKEQRSLLLQSASSELTRKFKEWWKQGEYKFRFQADGDYFRIWVSDAVRTEEVGLELRSTGLQWFLSFYLIFLVESKEAHRGAILLLDEAGLTLHPLAQKDLVAFFDNLSNDNQIINTTHSPFVIDTTNIDRCRVVYSDENGYTVASSNLRASSSELNSRSIYAVHAALGLNVSDVLLQGCKTVIVEGPSDQHYLNGIKDYLISQNTISPRADIVFVPSGGVKGVAGVASLLAGKGDELPVVLLDGDRSGNGAGAKLASGLYKDNPNKILSVKDFTGIDSSEIEDLIPINLMKKKINVFFNSVDEDEESFEDVYNKSVPLINQLEEYARRYSIPLPVGYKVELAKTAKSVLQKRKNLDIDEPYLQKWKALFEAIMNA